ncbi:ribbon-helix-helix domain-containing protein [Rhizobium sp. CC-YZS058]|uniref:ribbon-helix-helix domain-containing protein n=1 Tax=Rhizobium sp. CC-YZS058 TaxID=3042153 RepID=UPI002B05EC0A|nr:type II toxin-antitoxin system ParD family antitoxin [Rhizobium sp. CC-YZS058]
MPAMRKLTIEIPEDLALFVDAQVAAGHYASADEVLAEGLAGLAEDDAELEAWIEKEVIPVYDRVMANPSELLTHEEVFGGIEARLKARRGS